MRITHRQQQKLGDQFVKVLAFSSSHMIVKKGAVGVFVLSCVRYHSKVSQAPCATSWPNILICVRSQIDGGAPRAMSHCGRFFDYHP